MYLLGHIAQHVIWGLVPRLPVERIWVGMALVMQNNLPLDRKSDG